VVGDASDSAGHDRSDHGEVKGHLGARPKR
jgi:hypothetical protein